MNGDRDPVLEDDRVARFLDDERLEHGHGVQPPFDVVVDHAGLRPIRGNDHEDPTLARCEIGAIVTETCEIDGHERGKGALASTAANNEHRLARGFGRQSGPSETASHQRGILLQEIRHEPEEGGRTEPPRPPAGVSTQGAEQRHITHRVKECGAGVRSSTAVSLTSRCRGHDQVSSRLRGPDRCDGRSHRGSRSLPVDQGPDSGRAPAPRG